MCMDCCNSFSAGSMELNRKFEKMSDLHPKKDFKPNDTQCPRNSPALINQQSTM